MGLFMSVYSTMAWQNQSAYNSAPLSAHEARMGNILGGWRNYGKVAFGTVLGICAFTYMHHPAFAAGSSAANAAAHQLGDARIRGQMELVLGLTHLLPPGLKGMLCIVFVMAIFGGDSAHLHSWGGVFIQDVLMPLRKRMLTPQQHIRYLRLSITGVAVFAFVFGLSFHQTEYIVMWFQMTMGLFVSGAGIAIIGGLYWKTGTTTAAWTATLTGTGLTIAGIILRQIFGDRLPVNGIQIVFFASLIAILIYIAVSYLTSKDGFNMDRMLHRGAYAEGDSAPQKLRKFTWGGLIGIDENFTVNDKWVTGSLFTWNMAWFGVFAIGTVWNWIAPWPAWVWSPFWKYAGLWLPVFLAVVTGVWFTWGGIHDMKELFRRLKSEKTDALDNGMVMGHQNLAENPGVSEPAGAMQKPLKLNVAAEVKDVS
jgi:SSS family solute:Na+ symporter